MLKKRDFANQIGCVWPALFFMPVLLASIPAFAQSAPPLKALMLVGGIAHDYDKLPVQLAERLAAEGPGYICAFPTLAWYTDLYGSEHFIRPGAGNSGGKGPLVPIALHGRENGTPL